MRTHSINKLAGIVIFLLLHKLLAAQITLPRIFSHHMVLQRQTDIPVWGTAQAGSRITIELANHRLHTISDTQGKWRVRIPRLEAGGPYELKVYAENEETPSLIFKDVLIGDVWLASGQSNMEWQVQQSDGADEEIPKAANPNIRFFKLDHKKSLHPLDHLAAGEWMVCDSISVKETSAVAYYFAKELEADLEVPVGIIQSTWGGTPVEAWTSREMLISEPLVGEQVLINDTITSDHFIQDSLARIQFWDIVYNPSKGIDKLIPDPSYDDSKWQKISVPGTISEWEPGFYEGMIWLRKTIVLKDEFQSQELSLNLGHPEMNYSLYFNGREICKTIWNANPNHSYTIPASLITKGNNTIALRMAALWGGGALNPPAKKIYLTNGKDSLSLAGKWSYKNDLEPAIPKIYNYHYYPSYLYNAMLNPLIPYGLKGFIWYQGEANEGEAYRYRKLLPLMINDWRIRWQQGYLPFLFVQLPNYYKAEPEPSDGPWAVMRESQLKTLDLPNTGMACIIDLGEADNIHPTNKIEVGERLAAVAEKQVYEKSLIASGPQYQDFVIADHEIRISFSEVGKGLRTSDGKAPMGFAIAGKDQKFYWVDARIEGNEVVLSAEKVKKPVAVRYAWANNPDCNLVNSENLPAWPFRTDSWKVVTE